MTLKVDFAVNGKWSEGEIIYLCTEWAKGTPVVKIALEMERTPQTINRKARKIGLTPRVPSALVCTPKTDNGKEYVSALNKR